MSYLKIHDLSDQSDFEDFAQTCRLCIVKCSRERERSVKGELVSRVRKD